MRNNWYMSLVLVVVTTGCTAGGGLSLSPTSAKKTVSPRSRLAAKLEAPSKEPGFTQRMASSITSIIPGMGKKDKASTPPNTTKNDPISLGFKSGPPNAELYLSMAQLSDRDGNSDHARSMYQKALSLEPNQREALLGLARLEDRQGKMQDALRIYQQAATAYPEDAKVLNDLALCLARTGQLQASAELLDQASRLQPQKKLYRNNFAKVLIEMNLIDDAVLQLSAVHTPAIVQYNMGVLLNERGRTAEAVHFLTAASHIDPQMQEASILLVQIRSDGNQLAQSTSSSANDSILPTPITPGTQTVVEAYPATSAPALPAYQTVPAETAQAPIGGAPILLPPVR